MNVNNNNKNLLLLLNIKNRSTYDIKKTIWYSVSIICSFIIFNSTINYMLYDTFTSSFIKWKYDGNFIPNFKRNKNFTKVAKYNKKFLYNDSISLEEADSITKLIYTTIEPSIIELDKCKGNPGYVLSKFEPLAIYMQLKYNIPASITLSQILLETGIGTSKMFKYSNQLFGRKCFHNKREHWKMYKNEVDAAIKQTGIHFHQAKHCNYYKDDSPYNRFINYDSYFETAEDRYNVLWYQNRKKYRQCFVKNGKPTIDYKHWAHTLKKAGWATDPNYAYKLISLIESNNLQKIDKSTEALRTILLKHNELALQKRLILFKYEIKNIINDYKLNLK